MSGDLIPSDITPDKSSKNNGGNSPEDQLGAAHRDLFQKFKPVLAVLCGMAFIEAVSVLLWNVTEFFHDSVSLFLKWLSLCGHTAVIWFPISKGLKRPKIFWCWFLLPCAIIAIVVFGVFRNGHNPLVREPGFSVTLELENWSDIPLTNTSFIFDDGMLFSEMTGAVFLPERREGAELVFVINIPSPSDNTILICSVSTNLAFTTSDAVWKSASRTEDSLIGARTIAADLGSFPPYIRKRLPPIHILSGEDTNIAGHITLWFSDKSGTQGVVAFWLAFENSIEKPFVTEIKHLDGGLSIVFPDEVLVQRYRGQSN